MSPAVIPPDALIAQALEMRKPYAPGDIVYIRRSGHAVVRQEVLALCVLLGPHGCHTHYVVGPVKGDKTPTIINRSIYPASALYADAQAAFEAREPDDQQRDDPLNADIERAVKHHRRYFNVPGGNHAQ